MIVDIVTLVTNDDEATVDALDATIRSVDDQSCDRWRHIIVVDHLLDLGQLAQHEHRTFVTSETPTLADALDSGDGSVVVFLTVGDELERGAAQSLAEAFTDDVDAVYADHDVLLADAVYVDPVYKPDFSPERLRAHDYIGPTVAARRNLIDEIALDSITSDHDLNLRITERARSVGHVSSTLFHLRRRPVLSADTSAVERHCARIGIDADVAAGDQRGCVRVVRRLAERPLVSVIIPTRGSSARVWGVQTSLVNAAVESIVERSIYRELEFVVVYDTGTPEHVLDELERVAGDRLRLVDFDAPFNFSEKVNIGSVHARGDHLLLLNDDTQLIDPASIEVLVGLCDAPDAGLVGAKLLYEDGTLQHGGHVYAEVPLHACAGWPGDSPGPAPLYPLAVERECAGVTAAVAIITRDAFEHVGGMCTDLPVNFNDVDLSLKLLAEGYRNLWTPSATWYHFESRTRVRGSEQWEVDLLLDRWQPTLSRDPYYHANFVSGRSDWSERIGRPIAGFDELDLD